MKTKVTDEGILVPKELLEGMDEVEIHRQNGIIVITPVREFDHSTGSLAGASQDQPDPLLAVLGTLSGEMRTADEIERELYGD